jgi:uncharacterized protein DUF4363
VHFMNKTLGFIIPIVTLGFFLLIMLSGDYLKQPRNPSEDVIGYINLTMEDVKSDNWANAIDNIDKIEKSWNKIVPRIQFSVERDEIYNININIARLKGAAIVEDKSSALMELNAAIENWNELTR